MKGLVFTQEQYTRHQKRVKGAPLPSDGPLARLLLAKAPKGSKYGNTKVGLYDSRREARRAAQLRLLEIAGDIRDLSHHVTFVLIPAQYSDDGQIIERECSYIADFAYFDVVSGNAVVEDSKGFRTREYILKRKLMLYVHGICVRET